MATSEATKKTLDKAENRTEGIVDNVQDKITDVKEKISDTINSSNDTVQKAAETAQNFVNDKAGQINEYAKQAYDKAYEKANQIGNRAAEAISTSADYVKNLDVEKARDTVKTAVKERPELSIVVAALTGLVIGLLIGRSNKD